MASLETEAQLRQGTAERLRLDMQGMLSEERQGRERDCQALRSRVEMAEQSIFVDSGKREERDRDIRIMVKSVQEDLNLVRAQLHGQARPISASGSVSGRPGSATGSVASVGR